MPQGRKTSFLIILTLIFFLPLFFMPGGALGLENAKSAFLILGLLLSLLAFLYELWREGRVSIPKLYFLYVAASMPLVYLLSALLSTPTSLALFGYGFEVGTFGYMLLGSIFLVLSTLIFSDNSKMLQALAAFFLSLSLVAVFSALKILVGGDFLALGNFFGNMGNPLGNWTDLGIAFGLLAALSALTVGMIPMRSSARVLLYVAFLLSTALFAVIGFSTAFILTLIASILLLIYFLKVEKNFLFTQMDNREASERGKPSKHIFLPLLLGVVSLLFLINPTISEKQGTLTNTVTKAFGITNTEVRPSFSATLDISKAVLSQGALLGSGPNTFGHDWLIYKPANVNATQFWSVAFAYGAGFIPTQIASTGVLGTAMWLAFLVLLLALAFKAVTHIPESRAERFVIIFSLIGALYLWVASLLYVPSSTMLMLSFFFSGLLIASLNSVGIISSRSINIREPAQNRFVSLILLGAIVLAVGTIGWIGWGKTVAAYHFQKAIMLSNAAGTPLSRVEDELGRAVKAAPADIHYVALSRLNFSRAQVAANATTSLEENRTIFQNALSRSIETAKLAVNINPAGYENWLTLGTVYSALVPKPLAVEGAYENAKFAFSEALKRNPNNPEAYLLLARLELNKGDKDTARSFIRNAIALKENYAEAYSMLAELEVSLGNSAAAIASAEKLAVLVPNNPGLYLEIGQLKYSQGDFTGAENSLNKALVLSPDYANAKYYLGLTLVKLGRLSEAEAQFEDLAQTNPDNPTIMSALESLRQGKPTSPKQP